MGEHTRRMTVKVGRTVNIGNYESKRLDMEVSEDIPYGEGLRDNLLRLHQWLDDLIYEALGLNAAEDLAKEIGKPQLKLNRERVTPRRTSTVKTKERIEREIKENEAAIQEALDNRAVEESIWLQGWRDALKWVITEDPFWKDD